jgi:hypothetical protein
MDDTGVDGLCADSALSCKKSYGWEGRSRKRRVEWALLGRSRLLQTATHAAEMRHAFHILHTFNTASPRFRRSADITPPNQRQQISTFPKRVRAPPKLVALGPDAEHAAEGGAGAIKCVACWKARRSAGYKGRAGIDTLLVSISL